MDINKKIVEVIKIAAIAASKELGLEQMSDIVLEPPPRKEFGDFSSNIAMQLCKINRMGPPQKIANSILKHLKEAIVSANISEYIKDVQIKWSYICRL